MANPLQPRTGLDSTGSNMFKDVQSNLKVKCRMCSCPKTCSNSPAECLGAKHMRKDNTSKLGVPGVMKRTELESGEEKS